MKKFSSAVSNAKGLFQGRFARNSLWAILDQLTGLVLALIITVALARYMGATDLGRYSLAVALTSLISVITNLGLQVPVKREIAHDSSQTGLYLGQSLLIRWFLSLPLSVMLVQVTVLALGYESEMIMLCHLINVFIFLSGLFALNSGVLFSLHLNQKILAFNLAYRLSLIFCLFGIIKLQLSVVDYSYGLIAITFLFFMLSCSYIIKNSQRLVLNFDFSFTKNLIIISLPLALAAAVEFASLKIDTVILGVFHPASSIGYYAAAFNVLLAFIAVPMAVTKVFFPNFIQLLSQSDDSSIALKLLRKVLILFVSYSIPAGVVLVGFNDTVAGILYGDGFQDTAGVLSVFAIGIPIIVLNRLFNYVLIAVSQDSIFFFVSLVGLTINIVLNLLWIPEYSIYGAAAATIASESVVLLASAFFVYRFLSFKR